jgi:hypothetical protein
MLCLVLNDQHQFEKKNKQILSSVPNNSTVCCSLDFVPKTLAEVKIEERKNNNSGYSVI